ncbi:multicomponent Na+:H+ antiporter subunit D [Pontibacter aydingkolensis]|uniref:Na+/H+ antiporter subunit D n=1 Tax=Pontibacter aydingkolensis TaxID=1911536 RepID=A0ABS7CXG4_9BACT|nr:proton-conducting transporter membrane subunit [Pontibacter aydingkolensis]MBW7468536.1 Na+/H+ antiporter subunit D [Pontibacter aydingkolensis]
MSANYLLITPLMLPLLGAITCVFLWRHVNLQTIVVACVQLIFIGITGLMLRQVLTEGIQVTHIGGWPAPYGIALVADILTALLLLTTSIAGLAVFMFSHIALDKSRKRFGYFPLFLLLQMGVSGVCLTGDIFNLYVWFEVLLICCFALIALGSKKSQLEGALKYVTINFIASGLLLTGIGVMYALYGALNMAELAQIVRSSHANVKLLALPGVFFLTGFGIKAAIFPLFFWLPASYHAPPIGISAFIAGIISKIGIYTLLRLYSLIFSVEINSAQPLLLILSGLTMAIGVIGAAAQMDFRKILSFHIISQIGYMLMGLAIYTPLAIAGSIFFVIHNMLVKTNLFLVSGVVAHRYRSFSLVRLGGVYLMHPTLSFLFLISALSLAGLPPLSGFWGKLMLAKGGLEAGNYILVGTSLGVSLITLLSMTKIWNEVFWKPRPKRIKNSVRETMSAYTLYFPVFFLLAFILVLGFFAQPVIELSQRSADQLLHSETYIKAVLYD